MKFLHKFSIFLFILIELILFYIIIFLDIKNKNIYCFISILLAGLFPLILARQIKKYTLINLGLITTIFADIFLVLYNPQNQLSGIILFILTQIIYYMFLYFISQSKTKRLCQIVFVFIFIIIFELFMFIILKNKSNLLSFLSIIYFSLSLNNIIFAYSNKKSLFLALGLTLLLLCDIIIGLKEISLTYLSITENSLIFNIINSPFNSVWLFYLPSQVLISLFAINFSNKKES